MALDIHTLALIVNAAALATRSGNLNDINKDLRRAFSYRGPMPPEAEQQMAALATALVAFGESVRIADQNGKPPMEFFDVDEAS